MTRVCFSNLKSSVNLCAESVDMPCFERPGKWLIVQKQQLT